MAQEASDWGTRAAFFFVIALVMAGLVRRAVHGAAQEAIALGRERDLMRHKQAVIDAVSHEFRTPLTTTRGVLATLAQRDLVADAGRPLVDAGQRATRRLSDLVELVLAASEALDDANEEGIRVWRRSAKQSVNR